MLREDKESEVRSWIYMVIRQWLTPIKIRTTVDRVSMRGDIFLFLHELLSAVESYWGLHLPHWRLPWVSATTHSIHPSIWGHSLVMTCICLSAMGTELETTV